MDLKTAAEAVFEAVRPAFHGYDEAEVRAQIARALQQAKLAACDCPHRRSFNRKPLP